MGIEARTGFAGGALTMAGGLAQMSLDPASAIEGLGTMAYHGSRLQLVAGRSSQRKLRGGCCPRDRPEWERPRGHGLL
jgi:hypothetical protein